MSLFEYDQGHLIPAQFGHPVGSEAQGEILDSVRRQVLEVIARPLFPVTWSDLSTAAVPVAGMPADALTEPDSTSVTPESSPRLTALDGSGQVVLVEVMEKLNSQTLIESLARLGAISNLGWNDLAAAYPGGVGAFRSGWTQFRDAMPPNLTAGPRLILVTTEIDPGVRPALDALTTSGLEVHHVSVREMSNGRRFLDVQRVAASLFSHDTNLLAGRAARMPALTSTAAEDFSSPQSASVSDDSFHGDSTSASPKNAPSAAESGSAATPVSAAVAAEAPASAPSPDSEQELATIPATAPQPVDEPSLQTGSISRHSIMEAAKSSPVSPLAGDEDDEPVESLFTTAHDSRPEDGEPSFSQVVFGAEPDAEKGSFPEAEPSDSVSLHHHSHRADSDEAQAGLPDEISPATDEEDFVDINGLLSHDSAGLEAIAQVTGEDTPLFGQANLGEGPEPSVIQATLLERGAIELEGRTFSTPRDAALAVGAPDSVGDGWDFWHLGLVEGPSLAEACEEINVELRRELDS